MSHTRGRNVGLLQFKTSTERTPFSRVRYATNKNGGCSMTRFKFGTSFYSTLLPLCALLVALAVTDSAEAQGMPFSGTGTPNYIPQFTGTHTLGNSNIFQVGSDLGVNTRFPQATLDVESTDIFGILGSTSNPGPFAAGVIGRTASTSGNAVVGESRATSGNNHGVFGRAASPDGVGVAGLATATTGNAYGVTGETRTTGFGAGVIGSASATTGNAFGMFGSTASPDGVAVFGYASARSGGTGVVGVVDSPNGVAGRFATNGGSGLILQGIGNGQVFTIDNSGNGFLAGNLVVNGTVSKGGGSFKIDHPLDPANKTLSHSFVESPDMMDIYNGVVTLDAEGQASVKLPGWFESLNGDFRYLLTAIAVPQPELYIAQEIRGNQFRIAGGKPSAKVSWQVTGVRHDAYANAHRIKVEEDKPAAARGSYIHPEAALASRQETQGSANYAAR